MKHGDKRGATVYVDAKILNMHDPTLPHPAFVGYKVRGGKQAVKQVRAEESDDAEVQAILFAIDSLLRELGKMTIVCDHQSVVTEANRDRVKRPSPAMALLRETLRKNQSRIRLRMLQANPAHGVVTEYVNSIGQGSKTE